MISSGFSMAASQMKIISVPWTHKLCKRHLSLEHFITSQVSRVGDTWIHSAVAVPCTENGRAGQKGWVEGSGGGWMEGSNRLMRLWIDLDLPIHLPPSRPWKTRISRTCHHYPITAVFVHTFCSKVNLQAIRHLKMWLHVSH